MTATDFLVIGGGVIGISVARELKREYGDASVTVIEKEPVCGLHASGRNSGVLHAGFYYSADTLKARFTRLGNELLTEYCASRRLTIRSCGKLVVARTRADHEGLDELGARAAANGVAVEELSEDDVRAVEPRARTCERALYCPSTATVDPTAVMRAMTTDAVREGVTIATGVRYLRRQGRGVQTSSATYYPGFVVNAAGMYADRIGRDFGFGESYRMLPFKGVYLYSDDPAERMRTNVYPVPDLRMPFLGVHVTTTPTGRTKIGPNAIPAFWREQYNGWGNFRLNEFVELALRQAVMLLAGGWSYQRLAAQEIRKRSRAHLLLLASRLVRGVEPARYTGWDATGIRAQLVDMRRLSLVMDFVLEGDDHSLHILNAVSPGFTCSISFAKEVCRQIGMATGTWRRAALQLTL
jgi:L-2-hydroxyglutarate oxidase LhgO